MKKILVLTTDSKTISENMMPQLGELVQRGITVHCACNFDLVKDSRLIFEEVSIFTLPLQRQSLHPHNLKALYRLFKLQKENKYDVVYTYSGTARLCGALLKLQFKNLKVESFETLLLDSAIEI